MNQLNQYINCTKCNARCYKGARYCKKCGDSLTNQQSSHKECRSCSSRLKLGSKFCVKCGTKVKQFQPLSGNIIEKKIMKVSKPIIKQSKSINKIIFQATDKFTNITLSERRKEIRARSLLTKEVQDLEHLESRLQKETRHGRDSLKFIDKELQDIQEKLDSPSIKKVDKELIIRSKKIMHKAVNMKITILSNLTAGISDSIIDKLRSRWIKNTNDLELINKKLDAIEKIKSNSRLILDDLTTLLNLISKIKNKEITLKNALSYETKLIEIIVDTINNFRELKKNISGIPNLYGINLSSPYLKYGLKLIEAINYDKISGGKITLTVLKKLIEKTALEKINFEKQLEDHNNHENLALEEASAQRKDIKNPYLEAMYNLIHKFSDSQLRAKKRKSRKLKAMEIRKELPELKEKYPHLKMVKKDRKPTPEIMKHSLHSNIPKSSSFSKKDIKHHQENGLLPLAPLQDLKELNKSMALENPHKISSRSPVKQGGVEIDIGVLIKDLFFSSEILEETSSAIRFNYAVGSLFEYDLHIKGEIYELTTTKKGFWGILEKIKLESANDYNYNIQNPYSLIELSFSPEEVEQRLIRKTSLGDKFLKINGYKNLYLKNLGKNMVQIKIGFEQLNRKNLRNLFEFLRTLDSALNSL